MVVAYSVLFPVDAISALSMGTCSSIYLDGGLVGWVIGAGWYSLLDWHTFLCNGGLAWGPIWWSYLRHLHHSQRHSIFGLAILVSKAETRQNLSECLLGWIGAIGWLSGAMVALTQGIIWSLLASQSVFISGGCNISIKHGDSSSVYLDGGLVGWVIGAGWHS